MNANTKDSEPRNGFTKKFPAEEEKTQDQPLLPERPPQDDDAAGAPRKRPRGFAAMDRRLVGTIASKGGKAAHAKGSAHQFTSEEAREAGRKGGIASHAKRLSRAAPPEEDER